MRAIKSNIAFFFILPSLAGFMLFYIWPFFFSIYYALIDKPVGGTFVGLKNFIELLQNKAYLLGLTNTLIFVGISLPLNIALSLAVAGLANKLTRHGELIILIFLIPLVIPSGSTVLFWKLVFAYDGYINGILNSFGLKQVNWLETEMSRYVIILIFIWKNLGYNMVLFISGLNNIPKEYYEVADVEGISAFGRLCRVTLVYLAPTILLVTIMSIINSFKVFKEIYMITGSYPHESIYMLQHFMNNMFQSLNYQKLTSATCILVAGITVLTQALLRIERRIEL